MSITALNVAEKPSVAKAIAETLGGGRVSKVTKALHLLTL
jgi:hypothetical protein